MRQGVGRALIDYMKGQYATLEACAVQPESWEFWEAMGFEEGEFGEDGSWFWSRSQEGQAMQRYELYNPNTGTVEDAAEMSVAEADRRNASRRQAGDDRRWIPAGDEG